MSDRTLVRDLAWLILSSDFFARSPAGEIFRYEKGVYAPGGEFLIRQRVKHLLLELRKAEKWTRKLAREVIEFILLDTPELEATPSSDFINLENGILDVWAGEPLPHSPKALSTIRMPLATKRASAVAGFPECLHRQFSHIRYVHPDVSDTLRGLIIENKMALFARHGNGVVHTLEQRMQDAKLLCEGRVRHNSG